MIAVGYPSAQEDHHQMKVDPFTHQMIRFVSAMHVATYRLFGGIGPLNRNTLILTTHGRKSGRAIDKPLLYYQEGGKAYLVASYGGSDTPPAWLCLLIIPCALKTLEFCADRLMVAGMLTDPQATSCSRLQPAPAERVTRNEEGTERQSARSLNSPLGTTSCFSTSSQVPPIHTVC